MVRVTVILPVYNEEDMAASVLQEIDGQTYRDRELIVVDDGSKDGTNAAVAGRIGSRSDARIIRTEHLGPSNARNAGAKAANGDILFFTEADCTYTPDYIEKAVANLDSHPGSDAVCLTGAPLKTRSTLATECIEIENKVQHRLLREGKLMPFYAWVFRRDAFLAVGGYDERLFQGEDKDLFKRFEGTGHKVEWIPGIHWWHRRDQTIWSLAKKWFKRGKSRVLYSLKHKLVFDLLKTILPLWILIAGLLIIVVNPVVGILLVLAVAGALAGQSIRVAILSWQDVNRHWIFVGYAMFIAIRNFSTSIGYQIGLLSLAFEGSPGTRSSTGRNDLGITVNLARWHVMPLHARYL